MLQVMELFVGYGGFSLALKLALPEQTRTICYVDIEPYCQEIISARIKDGALDKAPIFCDIKAFIDQGYAGQYMGLVDVITAGPPCQPFSIAGKRRGEADPRNLWPETIEVIRLVRPRYVLLENVPNLLNSFYFGRILGDLAESGYDAEGRCLSAAQCGANHKRERLWIMAYAQHRRREKGSEKAGRQKGTVID